MKADLTSKFQATFNFYT